MRNFKLHFGDGMDLLRSLPAESVDTVLIDPPYGIDYQSNHRPKDEQFDKIANDERPFLGWGAEAYRVTKKTGCILVFYRWDVQEAFITELKNAEWLLKSQIIWNKVIHGMGDLKGEFGPQHENILFARKPAFTFPGKRPTTVYTCARVQPEKLTHPNEKPVQLLVDLITAVTPPGGTVIDFTMGSGTTGVAAMRCNCDFYGAELLEDHYRTAEFRIKNAAGEYVSKPSMQKSLFDI